MSIKHSAKKAAISKLRDVMSKMGGNRYDEGMSVKVMAKDKEGLKEGLEKAEEIVEKGPDMDHSYDDMSREEMLELLKSRK